MHCEKNFPLRKQQSDLDIGLDCGLNDEQYLYTMRDYLPWLLDTFRPDLVLYDAGVDPHQDDVLGRLCLTDQGKGSRNCLSLYLRPIRWKLKTNIKSVSKLRGGSTPGIVARHIVNSATLRATMFFYKQRTRFEKCVHCVKHKTVVLLGCSVAKKYRFPIVCKNFKLTFVNYL